MLVKKRGNPSQGELLVTISEKGGISCHAKLFRSDRKGTPKKNGRECPRKIGLYCLLRYSTLERPREADREDGGPCQKDPVDCFCYLGSSGSNNNNRDPGPTLSPPPSIKDNLKIGSLILPFPLIKPRAGGAPRKRPRSSTLTRPYPHPNPHLTDILGENE
jgi:hypothetical protein